MHRGGGAAGGVVVVAVGTFATPFLSWIGGVPGGNPPLEPAEFGLALGIVSGLFSGAAVGSFLPAVVASRDARLARAGLSPEDVSRGRRDAVGRAF